MEVFKEMQYDSQIELVELLNEWWVQENMPDEITQARVVSIFKKGDSSKFENYRILNPTGAFELP